jgi:hypothetical protein
MHRVSMKESIVVAAWMRASASSINYVGGHRAMTSEVMAFGHDGDNIAA